MSGSLRRSRSEEINPNTLFPRRSDIPFESQWGVMAIEVPENEEISGGRKNREEKVGSVIRRRRANIESIYVKKRETGVV